MSSEEGKMDLMTGVVLRVLKNGQHIDPYEEMQKLRNLNILIIFKELTSELQIYCHCLKDLCGACGCRLLCEINFKITEDESCLVATLSDGRVLTVADAANVFFYLSDWMMVKDITPLSTEKMLTPAMLN